MSSSDSNNRSVRSHSIHIAIYRDYHLAKLSNKLNIKLEKDFIDLERKFHSHSKWNQRADHRNIRQLISTSEAMANKPPMTLEEFLQHEKLKCENISKSKDIANQNIRRH